MEVIFFQPEPRVNARHEDFEISANQTSRKGAGRTLRHIACSILPHRLHPAQLAFFELLVSFCARGIHAPKNECRQTCSDAVNHS
jgi:hypothetical protein